MKRKDRIRSRVLALVMTAAIVFTGAVFSQAGTMKAEAAVGSVNANALNVGDIIEAGDAVTVGAVSGDLIYNGNSLREKILDTGAITFNMLSNYASGFSGFKVTKREEEFWGYYDVTIVGITGSGSNTSSGSGCDHTYEWTEEQAATADKDAVLAYKCTKCGHIAAYQNEANSAYFSFINDAVNKIKKEPQGGTVTIDTGKWISINKSFMEQLAKRPDVTFVIKFTDQKHVRRELVINPGTDYSKFVDSNGYYGFLYMLGVLNETGYPAAK